MIALLSSAKTLDFSAPWRAPEQTLPAYAQQAAMLAQQLRKRSVKELAGLMDVSAKIAQRNADRYRSFSLPHTPDNAKPAILAYREDGYRFMPELSNESEWVFVRRG